MSDDDLSEVADLLRTAEWRLRKVDADPADEESAAAARQLEKLAADVRRLRGSQLFREYLAICNWLGESDGIADFSVLANDYRARIGFDRWPEDGAAYLRAMIDLAKQASGAAQRACIGSPNAPYEPGAWPDGSWDIAHPGLTNLRSQPMIAAWRTSSSTRR